MAEEEKISPSEEPVSSEQNNSIDFSKAFETLEQILSTNEGQKQISDIISAFSQGESSNENSNSKTETNGFSEKAGELIKLFGSQKSQGAAFLEALKPFLKKERQEKIDTAIKITRAAAFLKQMGFSNKGGDKYL